MAFELVNKRDVLVNFKFVSVMVQRTQAGKQRIGVEECEIERKGCETSSSGF